MTWWIKCCFSVLLNNECRNHFVKLNQSCSEQRSVDWRHDDEAYIEMSRVTYICKGRKENFKYDFLHLHIKIVEFHDHTNSELHYCYRHVHTDLLSAWNVRLLNATCWKQKGSEVREFVFMQIKKKTKQNKTLSIKETEKYDIFFQRERGLGRGRGRVRERGRWGGGVSGRGGGRERSFPL